MKPVQKKNTVKDAHYTARLKIAMTAYSSGSIIFSQDTNNLYTPREFLDSKEEVRYKKYGLEEYHNFTLLYPHTLITGLINEVDKAKNQLIEAEKKLHSTVLKLLNTFELHPKNKNK